LTQPTESAQCQSAQVAAAPGTSRFRTFLARFARKSVERLFYSIESRVRAAPCAAAGGGKGWIASRPTRDCRYDVVLDDGERLYRVQVKYAGRRAVHCDGAVSLDVINGRRARSHVQQY
jgi:hypothetical protein